jgi:hypothetical protein
MPGNARRGRPQGKCHRKQTAGVPPVRVKRCGKSAPPARQRGGHGKPHPEQDHVGTRAAPRRYVRARQARFRADVRVGCLTGPATAPLDEWPSPGNRYRTRLTGHLAVLISGNTVWAHQAMPNDPPPGSGRDSDYKTPKIRTKTEQYRESAGFSACYVASFKFILNRLRTLAFSHEKTIKTH